MRSPVDIHQVGRLIRDDVRRSSLLFGLFAAVLLAGGLVRAPCADSLLGPSPWRVFERVDQALWLFGLLLAARLGQVHSIHRRAFWRTRPWSPRALLAAKLIEVLSLVWLPMACLQLVLLRGIEPQGRHWALWTGELFLVVGGSLLVAATVGALTRTVRGLVVAGGLLWLAVEAGPLLARRLAGLEGAGDAVTSWAVLTGAALVVLVATYTWLDRRRVVMLASVLFVGWIGSLIVPPAPPPTVVDPTVSVEVAAISPPQRKAGRRREDRVWLCVGVELAGRSDVGAHTLTLRGTFRGEGARVGPAGPGDAYMAASQQAWEVEEPMMREEPMTMIFNGLKPSRFERHRAERGTLELEIMIETWTRRILDQGMVRAGEVIEQPEGVETPLAIHAVVVDEEEREIVIRLYQKELLHLAGGTTESPEYLAIDPSSIPYEFYQSGFGSSWSSDELSAVDLPFHKAQRVWESGRESRIRFPARPDWAIGNPRDRDRYLDGSLQSVVSELRWQTTEPVLLDRRFFRRTLDDVMLGELACDPKLRPVQ